MEYTLKSGAVIDDADIEEIGRGIARGDLPGGSWSGPVQVGRPRLSSEPLDVISFKIPHSDALRIKQAAELTGQSRSGFLREAALTSAEKVLASVD